ncbi:TraG family conjugative transposon ATPase [Sphingobacterium sp. CZ-2]|uniref:TraG family conjugative transposon ATPase n=1 Tax=Sphingobacterium sp. CZ-2 TaxID=2557994 RepID=UPI0010705FC6|nr:TraG family conjugative transposon ATPase [Sphingobacterium sp. CZ-2]QBR13534.1 TraG family conjugative transposon ATPase [Sphingobacterium sp. CZ-2]
MKRKTDIRDEWPIIGYQDGFLLGRMGEVSRVYSLQLPEIFSLSRKEYENYHQAWTKAIRLLPVSSIVHKQDWFYTGKYSQDLNMDCGSYISQCSERYFHERQYMQHECYLILSMVPKGRARMMSFGRTLLHGSPVPRDILDPQVVNGFKDACGHFCRALSDSGLVQVMPVGSDGLFSTPDSPGLLERYISQGQSPGERILGDIDLSGKDIRIGDRELRIYSLGDVQDLPQFSMPCTDYEPYSSDRSAFPVGFGSLLGQLMPCDHLVNQYIFIGDVNARLDQLERKRLRLQSLAAYSRSNLIARDSTNDFLNEAIVQQRMPIRAHFNVMVCSSDQSELHRMSGLVAGSLNRMGCGIKVESVGAPQIFWAGIPGNAAEMPLYDSFDTFTQQACCFLNLESSAMSSTSPVGLRLGDRLSGRPLHVDISDEPIDRGITTNRNKFILGPSGSGKSFFTNHLVRSYHGSGAHVVLVDVGHSYQGLCRLLGGYYFTYSERDPISFNPFHIPDGELPDTEKRESVKALILALWKKDDEPFRRSEYVALSGAITGYFTHMGQDGGFACFDGFYEYLKGPYREQIRLEGVKDRDFDLENLLYVLRPFYKGGEFDFLLNARTNLDVLQQRFIVFELDSIKDHPILFPVVTLIIMEVFISKMRKLPGIRKMILIEEAWKALMKDGFAQYIQYLFKTVRKFFGEAIVVTQEIDDIISSPIVRQTIINNSDCKILLDQRKYENRFQMIEEMLGLSEKERAMVLSLNRANEPNRKYKEVFISLSGTFSRVYRTEVSLEEYLCYTTEEREKKMLEKFVEYKLGDYTEGIKAMAEHLRGKTGGEHE